MELPFWATVMLLRRYIPRSFGQQEPPMTPGPCKPQLQRRVDMCAGPNTTTIAIRYISRHGPRSLRRIAFVGAFTSLAGTNTEVTCSRGPHASLH